MGLDASVPTQYDIKMVAEEKYSGIWQRRSSTVQAHERIVCPGCCSQWSDRHSSGQRLRQMCQNHSSQLCRVGWKARWTIENINYRGALGNIARKEGIKGSITYMRWGLTYFWNHVEEDELALVSHLKEGLAKVLYVCFLWRMRYFELLWFKELFKVECLNEYKDRERQIFT